ncbi:short-chain dehydrogenase/reductase SDR [Thermocrinis albus DSM 14484]|uniref:Enoyl-[acyl-carrier-protein] reductase [NADH] n=1 Tax=Thermocrinis albus (strain DSM 14484 / JCM 11386 / HI 11/12) TaxID=638303 RepID=D3SPT5_THEAH|nr:enoyl-ACP reductase [Thermocrinis albus]ADC89172.1 short-chain dehydrogenase/reductase SDR [Thermocrinis albus DSM 14484]
MGLLEGKRALITGVANERSIAYGIAKAFRREGAELAFTYAIEKLRPKVEEIAHQLGSRLVMKCDVTSDEDIKNVIQTLEKEWGFLDILVHSIAYAPKEEFKGGVIDTSREGFKIAMDVSVYSLIALTREALPLMEGREGSIITLSYYGAEKVVPHYNVMGIAKAALESTVRYLAYDIAKKGHRINAISAGPVKTLAAYSITGFHLLMEHTTKVNPFGRPITIEDVGDTAVFLCSHWARGITGEVIHVDNGYHIMGVFGREEDIKKEVFES